MKSVNQTKESKEIKNLRLAGWFTHRIFVQIKIPNYVHG